ncbi:MAG: type II toxin-antitoxin system RelE/ParE family toxin [Candidatus Altiarchaeota archaeon]|nr:type II toxin-antitoxin system RelE/ParE family toxin [Candidatus Altiarchaeota archaeon]
MTEVLFSPGFASELQDLRLKASGGDGEAEYLSRIIGRGLERLESDLCAGQRIRKRLFPRYYIQRFGVNNLWRLRLDSRWRLIYSLVGDNSGVACIVLEVLNHKMYDRRFGYK